MNPDQATIRTYATGANFLCIFDDAGFKIDGLYAEATARKTKENGLVIESVGTIQVATDRDNLVFTIKDSLFRDFKEIGGGLVYTIKNNIKDGGVGTSALGAVAFVELADRLYELKLTPEQKIFYASRTEPSNHLDNVLPCVLGGITFSYRPIDEKTAKYEKFEPPESLHPVLVIPLDIKKAGGTTAARDAISDLKHTEEEQLRISGLKKDAIAGIISDDFQALWGVASELLGWERSETFLRNRKGVYTVNVLEINELLERKYGKRVILTPSGAGPAMVIHGDDPEVSMRAAKDAVSIYESGSHSAKAIPAPIRKQASIEDFVD